MHFVWCKRKKALNIVFLLTLIYMCYLSLLRICNLAISFCCGLLLVAQVVTLDSLTKQTRTTKKKQLKKQNKKTNKQKTNKNYNNPPPTINLTKSRNTFLFTPTIFTCTNDLIIIGFQLKVKANTLFTLKYQIWFWSYIKLKKFFFKW